MTVKDVEKDPATLTMVVAHPGGRRMDEILAV